MKIDNNYTNPLQSQRSENTQAVEKAQRQASEGVNKAATPQRDRLEISDRARTLSKARQALDETPDVRSEKVEGLKESIRQGNYQVPYNDLATKMVGNIDVKG
jgi:negative regulator of flagellin synthesis FlgM